MKKTICLITNWYPTKENPFQGLFFKEQAFAVASEFDFLVVHYREHMRKKPGKKYKISLVNEEKNTVEYGIDAYVPVSAYIADVYENFSVKHVRKNMVDGIGKYVSNRRKQFTRKTLIEIFEENFKDKFDVLYCVDAQTEAYNLQCVAEHFRKPYIVGEHAPVPWPGTLISDINKYAIEKANVFLAISNDKIRQLLLQNIKLPETVYIGNLIDEEKLKIAASGNKVKTFIIVAAHSFYKNYDLFIQVMNRLTEITEEPFKVMIVGYASNKGYSKNVEEFEEKIRNSRFSDRAELIPSVKHEEIGNTLNKADAFIMTSIQEGQPVSAMEAACCGLPVFSTRCGGVEDYVDESMGRIYAVNDAEGMAEGLKAFLEGKIKFDSEYIRENMVNKFGNKAFTKKYTDVFNRVIDDART